MNNFLVMNIDMICTQDKSICVEGNNSVRITASVGLNGKNLPDDVRKIQEAMNKIPPSQGGPVVPLAVTGICDERTWQTIHAFQRHHFGWSSADGKVDPDYKTIVKINEIIGTNKSRDLPFLVAMLRHYELALRGIRAAHSRVIVALSIVNNTGDSNGSGVPANAAVIDSLNRHFQLDSYPPGMRKQVLMIIYKVYDTMLNVLAAPGAEGPEIFEIDTKGKETISFAYTCGNGAYKRGQLTEDGVRADRIYFSKEGVEMLKNPDYVAYAITHEMAHFVGISGIQYIWDHALGWYSDPAMQVLTPDQMLTTADSYANFAHESRTNDSSRPAWLRTKTLHQW